MTLIPSFVVIGKLAYKLSERDKHRHTNMKTSREAALHETNIMTYLTVTTILPARRGYGGHVHSVSVGDDPDDVTGKGKGHLKASCLCVYRCIYLSQDVT
jgi:hypothetical protein